LKQTAKLLRAIQSHIGTWGRDKSHGVIRRLVRPHRLYRYTFDTKRNRVRYESIGWRVFLKTKEGNTTAIDILKRNNGFRFYVGEVAANWLSRAQAVEKRKRVAGSRYEPRILAIPAIHTTLLWFASNQGALTTDLFEYLDRRPEGKSRWMTKGDVDALVKSSVAAASRLWSEAGIRISPGPRRRVPGSTVT
jgi:hypothetical protein